MSDGDEYSSAPDLNGAAVPYPGKARTSTRLDDRTDIDFDADGLTLKMEQQAWCYSGRPQPRNYSERQLVHRRHGHARRRERLHHSGYATGIASSSAIVSIHSPSRSVSYCGGSSEGHGEARWPRTAPAGAEREDKGRGSVPGVMVVAVFGDAHGHREALEAVIAAA